MTKLTIPVEAMPVVEVLRRDVPRPKELPKSVGWLAWPSCRWGEKCPMGLHPSAKRDYPLSSWGFGGMESDENVTHFWRWWDSLTEPQAHKAMDLIWPVQA